MAPMNTMLTFFLLTVFAMISQQTQAFAVCDISTKYGAKHSSTFKRSGPSISVQNEFTMKLAIRAVPGCCLNESDACYRLCIGQAVLDTREEFADWRRRGAGSQVYVDIEAYIKGQASQCDKACRGDATGVEFLEIYV